MTRLSHWVLTHRLLVALVWVVVAAAGALTASRTVDRLSYDFALPGQPAYEVNETIAERFGGGGSDDPLLLVVRGSDAPASAQRLAAEVRRAAPGARTLSASDPGAGALTGADGELSVAVVYPPTVPGPDPYAAAQPRIEKVVAETRSSGTDVVLTGFVLLSEGVAGTGRCWSRSRWEGSAR